MNEIWKDIEGYEGLYQISNLGKIKSLTKNCILKPSNCRKYKGVNLYKNGITKTKSIHRLVAIAFIPNPNNYPCVNHIDCNKENNNADNLEWCTYKQNNNHNNHELKRKITNVINEIKKYDNNEKVINVLNSYYNNL